MSHTDPARRRAMNTANARERRRRLVAAGILPGRRWPDMETRFWSQVRKTDGCWEWTGRLNTNGYGQTRVGDRRPHAHRVAYELVVGPIPTGLQLDHLCRNRACVRPDHLEPVTQTENVRRGVGFSGLNARKTHCIHGHEFTQENTRILVDGGRRCRTCQLRHGAEYRSSHTLERVA